MNYIFMDLIKKKLFISLLQFMVTQTTQAPASFAEAEMLLPLSTV